MSARAVIFDMDGLLIDSERVILECWRSVAAERALPLDDELWLSMVGMHDAACTGMLVRLLGSAKAERLSIDCKDRYDLLVEQGLPLKDGAIELLLELSTRGVPLAIATSTRRERALIKLARCGIDHYFDAIATSSDVAHPKPAADIYLLAASRLGVPSENCTAIEDSEMGVRAAVAAGMAVIQVPDLVPASELTRSLAQVVASLRESRIPENPDRYPGDSRYRPDSRQQILQAWEPTSMANVLQDIAPCDAPGCRFPGKPTW
jgi:HAD superfamily hydrolase (TIGR01509 family)